MGDVVTEGTVEGRMGVETSLEKVERGAATAVQMVDPGKPTIRWGVSGTTRHYSDRCTIKLCERCGGIGHEGSKCASSADMETRSPADAVLAMVGNPGGDAVEKTSF